jgi:hypothetical protein
MSSAVVIEPAAVAAAAAAPEEVPEAKRPKTDAVVQLCAIGFCGIDESVSVDALAEVSAEYGGLPEWGVLFRPEMEGKPRFPKWEWVTDVLCKRSESEPKLQLAGHLCSTRCQEVLNGDATFVKQLVPLGFKRVQVNATKANNVDTSTLSESADKVRTRSGCHHMTFLVNVNVNMIVIVICLFRTRYALAPRYHIKS